MPESKPLVAPRALEEAIESFRFISAGCGEHAMSAGINHAVALWSDLGPRDRWQMREYLAIIGVPIERPASHRFARFVADCVAGRPMLWPSLSSTDIRALAACWEPHPVEDLPESDEFRPTSDEGFNPSPTLLDEYAELLTSLDAEVPR